MEKWSIHRDGQYDVAQIKYNSDGVSFVMCDDKRTEKPFEIIFRHENIVACNITDETYRADLWKCDSRFYKSEDSEYLNIFKAKSPIFPKNAVHYLIIGTNTIVDIIAKAEPEVKPCEKA